MKPYDLDLIEAAAQAAGYETSRMGPIGLSAAPAEGPIPNAIARHTRIEARRDGEVIQHWNPLDNDAQNLGLQQHLGIKTGFSNGVARAQMETPDESTPYAVFEESAAPGPGGIIDRHLEYRSAAVRRVVVRAAAHVVRPDPNRISATQAL